MRKNQSVNQCADCTSNDDGKRCKKNHLEFFNGRKCNSKVVKFMNRIRTITHPTSKIEMFYSDMERV